MDTENTGGVDKAVLDENIEQLMDDALGADYGVCIEVNDPLQFRDRAYRIRERVRNAGDARFDPLSFHISPDSNNDLWIISHVG